MKTAIKLISIITLCLLINGCGKVSQLPIDNHFTEWSRYVEDVDSMQHAWEIKGGVLKCTGAPRGYLYTNDSFTDFTMTLDWRWPDEKSPGKGGVLLDMTGDHKIWPRSLEAQINAGDAGDFWALDGYKLTGPHQRTKSLTHEQYGELVNISKTKPAEKPAGQWNSYKIIAKGKNVTLIVNGQRVNKGTRTNTSGGKICITSEGTGIEFRNIKITSN